MPEDGAPNESGILLPPDCPHRITNRPKCQVRNYNGCHYALSASGCRCLRLRHVSHTVRFGAAFWSHGSQHAHSHIRVTGRCWWIDSSQ